MNKKAFHRMCSRIGVALTFIAATAFFFYNPAPQKAQSSALEILLESKFDGAGNDGWTIVNGTQPNKWFVGTAAGSSAGTTENAAYPSNDPTGATATYDGMPAAFNYVYMYRDIDIPAELPLVNILMDIKGIGEGGNDKLFVYSIPTNQVPTPGSLFPSGALLSSVQFLNGQAEWTRVSTQIPPSQAGTSRRIMILWANDNFTPAAIRPSVAVDNIVITARAGVPLAGSYTVNNAFAPTANNFESLNEAIVAFNAVGVSAPTIFNVAAGRTFSEALPEITRSGTAVNSVTFQKSGEGANPIVRATGHGGLPGGFNDGLIRVTAADYLTFDGIDMQSVPVPVIPNSVSAVNPIDAGYLIRSATTGANGSQNITVKNSSITLDRTNINSFGILQSGAIQFGGGGTATSAAGANSFNKYYNLRIQNVNAGIFLAGGANFPDQETEIGTIDDVPLNFIGAATPDDIGSPNNVNSPNFGIRAVAQSNLKIFNTEIRNMLGTGGAGASIDGIWIDNSGSGTVSLGTTRIYNNRIHDIRGGSNTGGRVSGIRTNLTNNSLSVGQIYNNFIYNLDTTSTQTNSRRVIGIFAQESAAAAATHEVYFNSVRLAPTGIGASNSVFEIGNTTAIFKIQNNIFANFTASQTGQAKHYAFVTPIAASLGAAGSISNNNVLHITNPGNGFVGLSATTDRVNLPAWRSVTGTNDTNSRREDPQFVAPTDLHIRTDAPTPVEGTAAPIMFFNTDIDGDTRSAATPDIGADEGNFQVLVIIANDIAASGVTRPAPGSLVAQNTVVSPQAVFQNIGAADQTNVNVRLTITGPNGYSSTNDKTIASITSEGTATVTFDAAPAFAALGTYTATATILTADQNSANNTTTSTFTVSAPFSGNRTVGAGGDFPTLAAAIDSLNAIGISGATTFLLTDANYNTGTSPLIINPVAGASAANRLTIKPAAGTNPTISGIAGFNGLITLNGADFVTIDGSNNGTSSRNLTLINNSTNQHAVIYAAAAGNTDGAQNNVFKNINIIGGGTLSQGYYGIAFGGTTVGNAGIDHDNNRVENNNIQRTGRGIFFQGANLGNKNTGNVITRNIVGDAASVSVSFYGINVALEDNVNITENIINVRNPSGQDVIGITLGITNAGIAPTGLEVTNAVVALNRIESVVGEQGLASVGIAVAPATSGTNRLVNNTIAGVISPAAGTDNISAGILLGGGAGSTTQVYHNSVSMTGNRGTINNQNGSFGIAIAGNDPIVDLRNNIFSNTQTQFGTGTAGKSYAVGTASATFANLTSNFNLFYTDGTQAVFGITGGLLNTTGTERADLAAWRTATGKDTNSIFANPNFRSATDLHLRPNSPARNGATVISGVTTDIDGQSRDATPDIGADEFRKAADYDFDGDGRADISVFRPSEGKWYLNRSTAGSAVFQFGLSTDKLTPADFDGDGKTDVAVFRDGTWYVSRSFDNSLQIIQWGLAGDNPVPADYDGDGNADFAVFRPSSGDWWILRSSDNQYYSLHWGLNGDVPVIGDYDGDGKADITVFRPSSGVWYSLKSSNNQALIEPFGLNGDIPQSGDFNGDGRSDLAVFRPSDRTWYIARPTGTPAQNFDALPFGLSSDIPAPGDFDGDGRTDVAVYRDGVWYLLQSGSGLSVSQFGLSSDSPLPAAYRP